MALSVTGIGHDSYPTTVEDYRNLIASALPGMGAVGGIDQFPITPVPTEAGLAVEVGPGRAVLEGRAATGQGSYFVWSAEAETIAWPEPSAQPRVDALVLTVADAQYGDVETQGPAWLIVQGTASSTPSAPTTEEVSGVAPAGSWTRVCEIRVDPGDTVISPANIRMTLWPSVGRWRPLTLATSVTTYAGRTPAYRIVGRQVWLTGAIQRADGRNFTSAQTWGDSVLARVPDEARPPRISYGTFASLARRSQSNFVGGGLLRGEVQSNGQIFAYRDNWDYTTTWIGFDNFTYWLDY